MKDIPTYYITKNYKPDNTKCSPLIYESDFSTDSAYHLTMTEVADRIVSDQRFDERCRKNIEARERTK